MIDINRSFLENFAAVVSRNPDHPAIVTDGRVSLSYQQLFSRAQALGNQLRSMGATNETVIGISIEKSAEYIISMLGIWSAGAALLPLDPNLPEERLSLMARESGIRLTIVPEADSGHSELKPSHSEPPVCHSERSEESTPVARVRLVSNLEDDCPPAHYKTSTFMNFRTLQPLAWERRHLAGFGESTQADAGWKPALPGLNSRPYRTFPIRRPTFSPGNLAYIIFTSGSTGRPKGVMVEHRGIVNLLAEQIKAFQISAESRCLFYLSTNFDASISDIGTTLLSGATLFIEVPSTLKPGPDFIQMLQARKITHMDIPPSLLRVMDPADMPASLQTIIIGGEACAPPIVQKWAKRCRVINVYGPTESTVCTSLGICDPETWNKPLIGKPINGISYHLLDEQLNPVAPGTPAELYITGIALARGYLNREELNSTKFIHLNGRRHYRTGDLVRQDMFGEFEFLGRIDRQVKLRGMLIEPEEIESRLQEVDEVGRAVVIKRPLYKESAREILVAFIVPKTGSAVPAVSAAMLREHLSKCLPNWMLPQRYEFIDHLPHTVTGKPDTAQLRHHPLTTDMANMSAALPAPVDHDSQSQTIDVLNPRIRILSEVWKEILGVEAIGTNDDFYDLGGDSFAALEVVVAAEARGLTIPPSILCTHTTVGQIVSMLEEMEDDWDLRLSADGAMACTYLRQDVELTTDWKDILSSAGQRTDELATVPATILITGSTGFLGARLLDELLQRSSAQIYCLVRAANDDSAMERIIAALKVHGKRLNAIDLERIRPVCGNLEQECFGLTSGAWQKLSAEIDTVYHCAAHVNMLLPYGQLRRANVDGTLEVIRLLCHGRRKWLHYASTLSTFVATDRNTGTALESDNLNDTAFVYGGYAQSKWAAEVLLRSLNGSAGPMSIHRFGLITGDSQTGKSSDTDFLNLFIRGLSSLTCVPPPRTNVQVDVTPIDFAAAAMSHLSLQSMSNHHQSTYHLANPIGLSLTDLVDHLRACGIAIDEVSTEVFMQRLNNVESRTDPAQSAACLALCRLLSGNDSFDHFRTMDLFQATDISFDMTNTLTGLADSGLICPAPDRQLIRTYAQRLMMTGTPLLNAG